MEKAMPFSVPEHTRSLSIWMWRSVSVVRVMGSTGTRAPSSLGGLGLTRPKDRNHEQTSKPFISVQ